ncbi:MAG: YqiJ family protein [Chromatiales bacterium]|jgi:hypothetical protein
MLEFLTADGNVPFSVALALMFGIAFLEGVASLLGFALSNALDSLLPDLDLDVELDLSAEMESPSALSRLFSWLRVGQVPVLMLLVIFLAAFGLIGLALQSFAQGITGFFLPGLLMSVPTFVLALPVVRVMGGVLNRVMPKDETDAVSEDSLVGRIATITLGTASVGSPAEARVRDVRGTTHYVMVEPDVAGVNFTAKSSVLLVRKEGAIFKVIANTSSALVDGEMKPNTKTDRSYNNE